MQSLVINRSQKLEKKKEIGNFDKKLIDKINNHDDDIYRAIKFEHSAGNVFDSNEFDLSKIFLNNIFNGKKGIDESLIKQEKIRSLDKFI